MKKELKLELASSKNKIRFSKCWIPDEWKNKISVEDDLLPVNHFNRIQSYVTSKQFPWLYEENIAIEGIDKTPDTIDNYNFGFASKVFENISYNGEGDIILNTQPITNMGFLSNTFINFLIPQLVFVKNRIGLEFTLKARFDMTTRTPNKEYVHNPHIDFDSRFPHIACIIYMNDSDGDTIIFNETSDKYPIKDLGKISMDDLTIKERIHPKKGRILLFDGSLIHTGCSPYNNKNRILLNSQFTNIPDRIRK